jgi:hypothetical protein
MVMKWERKWKQNGNGMETEWKQNGNKLELIDVGWCII